MGHREGFAPGRRRPGRGPPSSRPSHQGRVRLPGFSRRADRSGPIGRAQARRGHGTASAAVVTVVLDAYAVIAALVGEPARAEVEPHLATACISAANLAEVVDVCVRVHGNAELAVRERIDWLRAGGLEVVALDAGLALAAGASCDPAATAGASVRSAWAIAWPRHWPLVAASRSPRPILISRAQPSPRAFACSPCPTAAAVDPRQSRADRSGATPAPGDRMVSRCPGADGGRRDWPGREPRARRSRRGRC
jgi:PIN domain nuclease of toxin-antitoxin system